MFHPGTLPGTVFLLFVPEDAVVVPQAGDEIRDTVAVNVLGEDEACRPELKLRMKNPLARARVLRCLKPAFRRNDIGAFIAVHITCADAMAITLRADLMLDPRFGTSWFQFVPGQRRLFIPELGQQLQRFP